MSERVEHLAAARYYLDRACDHLMAAGGDDIEMSKSYAGEARARLTRPIWAETKAGGPGALPLAARQVESEEA